MAYTPNPADPTEPLDSRPAGSAAAEFRALKAFLAAAVIAGLTGATVRQSVQAAKLDSSGYNTAITTGAGLRPGLSATATPYQLSYASGFTSGKPNDLGETISADNADILGADLSLSNTSYLYRDYGVGYGSCLIPPQYGYAFDRTQGALLNFEAADASTTMVDDFGNTWTASGNAQIDTAQFKFGSSSLLLDGTGDYIESSNFTSLGDGSWELSGWFRANSLAANYATVMSMENAAGFGVNVYAHANAGTPKVALNVSSDGTTNNVVNATNGTTTIVVNTWYKVRMVFDSLAGTYRLYLSNNGAAETQEITASSTARVCGVAKCRLGRNAQAGTNDFNGWIDGFRFIRAATVTSTETPAAAAFSITNHKVHFFSIPGMTMYEVTAASASAGTDPTLTAETRLFLGEADTSGAAVTAVRNYALQGKWEQSFACPNVSTRTSKTHNLGVVPKLAAATAVCLSPDTGYSPGEEAQIMMNNGAGNAFNLPLDFSRNSVGFSVDSAQPRVPSKSSPGTSVALTQAKWNIRLVAQRGW